MGWWVVQKKHLTEIRLGILVVVERPFMRAGYS